MEICGYEGVVTAEGFLIGLEFKAIYLLLVTYSEFKK